MAPPRSPIPPRVEPFSDPPSRLALRFSSETPRHFDGVDDLVGLVDLTSPPTVRPAVALRIFDATRAPIRPSVDKPAVSPHLNMSGLDELDNRLDGVALLELVQAPAERHASDDNAETEADDDPDQGVTT